MVDHNNRNIFIHIAKTGGSSVTQFYGLCALEECRQVEDWEWEHALNEEIFPRFNEPYSDGVHASISEMEEAVERVHGLPLSEYHSFTVIRDPAYYVRSCWNEWHQKRFPDFSDFVADGWFKNVIVPQIDHITINKQIAVDRIFLFEQLPDVFQHVRDITNNQDIPNRHSNRKIHNYHGPVIPWLTGMINEWFYEDYNLYESIKRNI